VFPPLDDGDDDRGRGHDPEGNAEAEDLERVRWVHLARDRDNDGCRQDRADDDRGDNENGLDVGRNK
jgi:hypothetical protein